jgi:ferric-dicitrate binding protein FerR (iron transport regulator)
MTASRGDKPTPGALPGQPAPLSALPSDLAALDAALRQRARRAAQAPSNALAPNFLEGILAKAQQEAASPILEEARPSARVSAQVVEIAALRSEKASRLSSPSGRWRWAVAAASIAILAALSGSYLLGAPIVGKDDGGAELRRGAFIVAQSQPRWFLLDGERIRAYLAPGSEMEIHSTQRVALNRGEAWFMVIPDSGPFAVETAFAAVHVTGTTFNVSHEGGGLVARTHYGSVRVEPKTLGAAPVSVSANEQWLSSAPALLTSWKLETLPARSGTLWDWAKAGGKSVTARYPSAPSSPAREKSG